MRDGFRVEPDRCGGTSFSFLEIEMCKSPKYGSILSWDEKKDTHIMEKKLCSLSSCHILLVRNSYQKVNSSIGGRKLQLSPCELSRKAAERKILYPWCSVQISVF